jgi:hypothetical protein
MARVAGLTTDDLPTLHGDYDLGWNATGVIRSHLHISAEEIIIREEMPGAIVEEVMAEVARFADQAKNRKAGMVCQGKIPLPIWAGWRKEWERGPKLHGVLWKAFLMGKLLDRDYSKFRVKK